MKIGFLTNALVEQARRSGSDAFSTGDIDPPPRLIRKLMGDSPFTGRYEETVFCGQWDTHF